MAGRPLLPAESCSWLQQRENSVWHGIFKQMWVWSHSLSCNGLKGAWPSTLGPSITHFNAWCPKEPSVRINAQWMHINTKGGPLTSMMVDQEAKDACLMLCNPKHVITLVQHGHANKQCIINMPNVMQPKLICKHARHVTIFMVRQACNMWGTNSCKHRKQFNTRCMPNAIPLKHATTC